VLVSSPRPLRETRNTTTRASTADEGARVHATDGDHVHYPWSAQALVEPIARGSCTSSALFAKGGLLPFTNSNRLHALPPCTVAQAEAREGIVILDEALSVADAYCAG